MADTLASIDWVARAQRLAPAIEAAIPRIEADGRLPAALDAALHEAGLYRMLIPRSCGGFELDPMTFFETIEALARTDASTAWCVGQTSATGMAAAYVEPANARDIFSAPGFVLAWGPPISRGATRARIVDGGYRVSGTWQFASGSRQATWLGGLVTLTGADGSPIKNADGEVQTRTVLFPKENATITDTWQVIGLRGTGSDRYAVGDLFVPAGQTFTRERAGWREPGPLYRMSSVHLHAIAFAAVALGVARAMLDAFVDLARNKLPRRGEALRENNAVQARIGYAEAQLRAARAYVLAAARTGYAEAQALVDTPVSLAARIDMRAASTFGIAQAEEVVNTAYRLAGSTAIFEAQPFERRFRDMHAVTQQIQAHLSNYETIGQYRLDVPFDLVM